MKNIIKNLIFVFVLLGVFSVGINFAFAAPSVLTVPPSSNTNSVTLRGVFIANGAQTTTMFEYSTNQNDLPDGQAGNGQIVCQVLQPTTSTSGPFSCTLNIPSITAGTTYYVRAIASNITGTDYGSTTTVQTVATSSTPSVITGVPSATSSSITFNGTFIANGAQTTTMFEYSTNQNNLPSGQAGNGIITCQTLQPSSNQSGSFACTLNVPTISTGTIYYLRAIASNINGTAYGSVTSIQTNNNNTCSNPPTISSISPTNVNEGSGTTNIVITGSNFINGTSQALYDGNSRTTVVSNSTSITMTLTSSDVASNGTHNISVSNGTGCVSSNITFTVNNVGGGGGGGGGGYIYPTVNTINTSGISGSSAVLNGTVNPRNRSTRAWFEYGTSSNLLSYNETAHLDEGSESGTLDITQSISGLTPNTIYYFRAAASNSSGTKKGNILSFKTLANSSNNGIITTVQATNQYSTSAKLNGIFVNEDGSSAKGYFEYGTSPSFGSTTSMANLGTTSSVSFSNTITNLSPNTIYYFKAMVNKDGITYTGRTLVFQTTSGGSNTDYGDIDPGPVVENNNQSSIIQITTNVDTVRERDEIEYLVSYKNTSSKNFEDTIITVQLPDAVDFEASDFGKENNNNSIIFNVGTLLPGQNDSIKILGKLNDKANDQSVIVTTAILSYTSNDSFVQKEEIAYITNKVIQNNSLGAASIFGNGSFLPTNLIGWLALILIVLGFIVVGRNLYASYSLKKTGYQKTNDNIDIDSLPR